MDDFAAQLDSIGEKILSFFDPNNNFAGSTKVSLFQELLSLLYTHFFCFMNQSNIDHEFISEQNHRDGPSQVSVQLLVLRLAIFFLSWLDVLL